MRKLSHILAILFTLLLLIILIFYKSPIQLAPGDNNATFVSQDIPLIMDAGQAYQINITLRNTGVNTWTAADRYLLGNYFSADPATFGPPRVALNESDFIEPGQTKKFTFWLSAPQNAGDYYLEFKMVQEQVEWFGIAPRVNVRVLDNRLGAWGNADPEPAIAWLTQSSSGKGAWSIIRPRDNSFVNEPGPPCSNGFGWNNTQLTISQLNKDGTITRKEITVKGCLLGGSAEEIDPWGSTPDRFRFYSQGIQNGVIIPEHWAIEKSSGLKKDSNGKALEEYQPYPGTITVPPQIIPDGEEHLVQKCYSYETYYSENGGAYACYDATCSPDQVGSCPGRGNLINTKYIVYDYCEGNFCYANEKVISSPVNFKIPTPSVLRVSYTLTTSGRCTDAPILTEEQWFAESVGFIGFSNNWPFSPAPNSVDFYGVFENQQCLPYWDGLCNIDPYNYNTCCPPGHPGCTVYLSDRVIPSIALTSHTEGQNVVGPTTIEATAADNIGIEKVDFYIDNFLKGTDTTAPYTYAWDTSTLSNRRYKITARAYDLQGNFATTPLIKVNLSNPASVNNARFVSQQVEQRMKVNQQYQVNITFNNTGTKSWARSQDHSLGSQNPEDNTIWGLSRILLNANEIIAPGQTKTFTFNVVAPNTPGSYNFSWEMIQDGDGWFGDASPNLIIVVTSFCGDNICNASLGETCNTCSVDCGSCGSSSSSSSGSGGGSGTLTKPQCNDKRDNDNDGKIDFPDDLGCSSLIDNTEYDSSEMEKPNITLEDDAPEETVEETKNIQIRVIFGLIVLILVVGIAIISIIIIRNLKSANKFKSISKVTEKFDI